MEIWKDIEGYEGIYQVSDKGNVKSLARKVRHPKGGFKNLKERTLKATIVNGYYQVDLSKEGKIKRFLIHRIVAKTFIDNHLGKPQVNHIDGNKLNNDSRNLEWVTSSENVLHSYENGLSEHMKGILNGHARIGDSDVLEIRRKYSAGYSQKELGSIYKLSESTVQCIVEMRTWKHLKGEKRKENFTRSKSGYKWVERIGEKYRGRFTYKGKKIDCGLYETAIEAYNAVLKIKTDWT